MASPVAAAKKVLRNAVKQRLAAVPAEAVVSQSAYSIVCSFAWSSLTQERPRSQDIQRTPRV